MFHNTRDWSFGPAPFSVDRLESVLTRRGYREVEELVDILLEMDLTFRLWYKQEQDKNA